MDVSQKPEDDPVLGHGEDHPGQREHCAEEGGGESEQRAHRHDPPAHRPAHVLEGEGEGGGHGLLEVGNHEGQDGGNPAVREEDDEE